MERVAPQVALVTIPGFSVHPEYFETRFRTDAPVKDWATEFVIVSAYATAGNSCIPERNATADAALRALLGSRGGWLMRVTCYSPTTDHAEPSWAVVMPIDEASDLGLRFEQDAIYVVRGEDMFVSHCDARRELVPVGRFRERLNPPPSPPPLR